MGERRRGESPCQRSTIKTLSVCLHILHVHLSACMASQPASVCLSTCLFVCLCPLHVCLLSHLSTCLFVCTYYVCLSVCMPDKSASLCVLAYLSVCLPVPSVLFARLSTCLFVCLPAPPPLPPPTQLTSLNNGCSHGFSLRSLQLLQGSHSLQTSLRVLLQVPA